MTLLSVFDIVQYDPIFRCRETERIFRGGVSATFPSDIQARARNKLVLLNDAVDLNDLRQTPGNRLEALKGDRAGQYSIRCHALGPTWLQGAFMDAGRVSVLAG